MKATKHIQIFVHKHYNSIKLGLLLFIGLISVMILVAVAQESERQAEERNKAAIERAAVAERGRQSLGRALNELKQDNKAQTKLIACLFTVHGVELHLEGVDAEGCQKALQEANLEIEAVAPGGLPPQDPAKPVADNSPQPTSPQQPQQLVTPEPKQRGLVEQITKPVSDLLNRVLGVQ